MLRYEDKLVSFLVGCLLYIVVFQAVQNKLKQQKERLVDDALQIKAPRSFVVSHGTVNSKFKKLVQDFRKVMEPFTASKLEVIIFYSFFITRF